MTRALWLLVLLFAGCGNTPRPGEQPAAGGPAPPEPARSVAAPQPASASAPLVYPTVSAPPEPEWPPMPETLPAEASVCVRDYQTIAREGLPPRAPHQPFRAWYAGPFQTWTVQYNRVRERCDPISSALPTTSPAAQALLAAQSSMHARLGLAGEALSDAPQMFVMSRYWTLGAACTYALCAGGEDRAWARFCRAEAASLPPCPPVEPSPEGPR